VTGAPRCQSIAARESERELEVNRLPIAVIYRDVLEPAAKIGAQILDFGFPYAGNRGS